MLEGKSLLIVCAALLLLLGGFAWLSVTGNTLIDPSPLTFEECAARGYEVDATPPRVCTTPEGITFTEGGDIAPPRGEMTEEDPEILPTDVPPPLSTSVNGCVVAGCSSQLCVPEGDPGFSTCEYLEAYACYERATCERQANGQCGWTETPELLACLQATPEASGTY